MVRRTLMIAVAAAPRGTWPGRACGSALVIFRSRLKRRPGPLQAAKLLLLSSCDEPSTRAA